MPRQDMIRARRGTAAEWALSTDILYSGELAWASDTNEFKLGDGFNTFSALPSLSATDATVAALVTGGGPTETALNSTIADTERTFTEKQVFDTTKGFGLGPNLRAFYDEGNAGTRFTITGDGVDAANVMPYLQMQLNTRTGSDGGHAIGGFQIQFAGPGGGSGGNNREYYMVEIIGENHPEGPHARIGMARSGTGERRPMWYVNGDDEIPALGFEQNHRWMGYAWTGWAYSTEPWMQVGQVMRFAADNNLGTAIEAFRYNGSLKALGGYVYSDTGTHAPYFDLGHSRGSIEAPTAPGVSDILGQIRFVSPNTSGVRAGATIRATTGQAWTWGSAEGSRIEFLTKKNGSTTEDVTARLTSQGASVASGTGLTLLVNREGTAALAAVSIGAADSGGTGFRQLLVAN